jgi:hypothetical protein
MTRAFIARCKCHGDECQCEMPDGKLFTVDLAGAEPSRFTTFLNPAEAEALRASADFVIINASHERVMSKTIFEQISASGMTDEKKNILSREVKNLHAQASRMQLRVGADGFVDKHDLTAALKRTYRPDQIDARFAMRQRFVEHGLVVERPAN